MIRRSLLALGTILATATAALPQAAPLEINAIMPLTGPAAFLGSEEANVLPLAQEIVNKRGGVGGRPIKFVVQDDGSIPQNSVALTSGLIAKRVPVVLGSSVAATCNAMIPLAERGAGPVVYCLSPIIQPVNGSYAFTVGIAPKDFEPAMVRFAVARGWSRIAMINSVDATGQAMEKEFDLDMQAPEAKSLSMVAREHFSGGDISVAAQVAQVKAQRPQVILSFAAGTSFGTLLRGLHDAGLDLPVIGAGGNMIPSQLDQYKAFIPKELYFFNAAGVAADPAAVPKVRDAQRVYFDALHGAGLQPGVPSAVAWDSAMLIADALRSLGAEPTALQLRDYFEHLQGWGGVSGMYDFRQFEHRGLGPSGTVAYRWDAGKREFAVVPQRGRR